MSEDKNGVVCWLVIPISPKNNLPESSPLKHIEKEFLLSPSLARKLGIEISPGPRPITPSGATPVR